MDKDDENLGYHGPKDRDRCAVCIGGWGNYWSIVLAGKHAFLCSTHIDENTKARLKN